MLTPLRRLQVEAPVPPVGGSHNGSRIEMLEHQDVGSQLTSILEYPSPQDCPLFRTT